MTKKKTYKMPTKSGLYFAKDKYFEWYNLIVAIGGKAPKFREKERIE